MLNLFVKPFTQERFPAVSFIELEDLGKIAAKAAPQIQRIQYMLQLGLHLSFLSLWAKPNPVEAINTWTTLLLNQEACQLR